MSDPRRDIPSVDRLLASPGFEALLGREPRPLVVEAVQRIQTDLRSLIAAGCKPDTNFTEPAWYLARVEAALDQLRRPSLRPVINGTGVVLHTNLGRAPLAKAARQAVDSVSAGYSNLEYDVVEGGRGSRYTHCAQLIERLTGAEAALVVNNNAAALVLALNTLSTGRDTVISRGELVEIGGSFRVPEILVRSGARLREVGSTNRTHAKDYREAVTRETGAILKVHPSNFRIEGFTADVDITELAPIALEFGVPLIHDLGSGLLIDSSRLGLPHETTAADCIRDGADVVTMSGDKLLGGPQAGILAGKADLIRRMQDNPLCRALRVDRMTLAALEATLTLYLDPDRAIREIPVLRMLTLPGSMLAQRAESMVQALSAAGVPARTMAGSSAVGGGAFPTAELPTWLVRLDPPSIGADLLERRLRNGDPPVIARIADDHVIVDPRTLNDGEEATVVRAITNAIDPDVHG